MKLDMWLVMYNKTDNTKIEWVFGPRDQGSSIPSNVKVKVPLDLMHNPLDSGKREQHL